MSDVLHREHMTPTQAYGADRHRRFLNTIRATAEAAKPKPVNPEIEELRSKLRAAEIEIDDCKKRLADQAAEFSGMKMQFSRYFAGNDRVMRIQIAVAAHYGMTRGNLMSAYRGEDYVKPRHIAMYLAKTITNLSLPVIGRLFGGRDHTTILSAVRKIEAARKLDSELDALLKKLAAEFGGDE